MSRISGNQLKRHFMFTSQIKECDKAQKYIYKGEKEQTSQCISP